MAPEALQGHRRLLVEEEPAGGGEILAFRADKVWRAAAARPVGSHVAEGVTLTIDLPPEHERCAEQILIALPEPLSDTREPGLFAGIIIDVDGRSGDLSAPPEPVVGSTMWGMRRC